MAQQALKRASSSSGLGGTCQAAALEVIQSPLSPEGRQEKIPQVPTLSLRPRCVTPHGLEQIPCPAPRLSVCSYKSLPTFNEELLLTLLHRWGKHHSQGDRNFPHTNTPRVEGREGRSRDVCWQG